MIEVLKDKKNTWPKAIGAPSGCGLDAREFESLWSPQKNKTVNFNRLQIVNKIARKMFKNYHGKYPEEIKNPNYYRSSVEGALGMYRKIQKPCSKFCCGNPRKWFGERTIQERKNIEAHII